MDDWGAVEWFSIYWAAFALCAAWIVWAVVLRQGGTSEQEAAAWPFYVALRAVRWVFRKFRKPRIVR